MNRRTVLAGLALSGCAVPLHARTAAQNASIWTAAERQLLMDGLRQTKAAVLQEASDLSAAQWNFRESAERWSIAEIVEHLGLQEDMYFREIYLISQVPAMPEFREKVQGKDEKIPGYATDPEKGAAAWFLQPQGRWQSREQATNQFSHSREKMIEFIRNTREDLRVHFTFRDYVRADRKESLWLIRDLHQLVLTTIAHTDRHVGQMKKVKAHQHYPKK